MTFLSIKKISHCYNAMTCDRIIINTVFDLLSVEEKPTMVIHHNVS